jgi:anti-sigma factor RsiW
MANSAPLTEEDREKLIAFLDGELDDVSAREWEVRLRRDPQVRAEADALSRTWELLDYLNQPEPSPTFTSRTLERISVLRPAQTTPRRPIRWQPWAFGAGWAAAVVLAFLLGYVGVSRLVPAPPVAVAQAEPADLDESLVRDLRVIENLRLYETVDDINFLRELADDPELFGEEN